MGADVGGNVECRAELSAVSGHRGKGWEVQLDVWHDAYRREQLAWIQHLDAPFKQVGALRPDNTFLAVRSAQGPPDYVGVVHGQPHGVPVVFDAKEAKKKRWSFGLLHDHQARDLSANDLTGFSFIALMLDGAPWVVPWSALSPMWWAWRRKKLKKASLTMADAEDIGLPMSVNDCCLTMDKNCGAECGWIPAVRSFCVDRFGEPHE